MTKSRDAVPPSVVVLLPAGYSQGSWLWLHMFQLPLSLLSSCELPVEVAKLLCLEEDWNSGRQNVPWARESGLAVVNLLISMHWDLGNTPCLCSPTKLFFQWSA